jgi:hypothetical protein
MNLQNKTLEELKAMAERLWEVVKQTETAHNIATADWCEVANEVKHREQLESLRLELLAQGYTAPAV